MDSPQVSFITVNYNGKKFLKICLNSILALDYPQEKLEIIVVDNSSQDGSGDFIKQNYPQVKLIKNPLNNYCTANNLGIRASRAEYIALVNNDVELDKYWLKNLLSVIQKDERIAGATGKILLYNQRINSTGHRRLAGFYWQDRGFGKKDNSLYEKIEEIEGLSHCACLYRKSSLLKVGLLDEDFNMYLEDVDMCLRLRKKGYKIYYSPEALCYHQLHGSAKKSKIKYFYERNRLLLVAKHYPLQLKEAIFDGHFFSTVERLDKKFLFSVLDQIKQKTKQNIPLESLKNNIEEFQKKHKLRIFFMRLIYNLLYYIEINRLIPPIIKKFFLNKNKHRYI